MLVQYQPGTVPVHDAVDVHGALVLGVHVRAELLQLVLLDGIIVVLLCLQPRLLLVHRRQLLALRDQHALSYLRRRMVLKLSCPLARPTRLAWRPA